jgi:hypothetical protein
MGGRRNPAKPELVAAENVPRASLLSPDNRRRFFLRYLGDRR